MDKNLMCNKLNLFLVCIFVSLIWLSGCKSEPKIKPLPLKRSLADFELALGEGMRLINSEKILNGVFAGFLENTYKSPRKGLSVEIKIKLITKNWKVYRKTLILMKSDIAAVGILEEGEKYIFRTFFAFALYTAAFDASSEEMIENAKKITNVVIDFEEGCYREYSNPDGIYYKVYNGYAFGCINDGTEVIKLDVVSEEVYKNEKQQRLKGEEKS